MNISLLKQLMLNKFPLITLVIFGTVTSGFGQSFIKDMARNSARSDIRSGGVIERSELSPGAGDLQITVNVPAFQMTLWQENKEIKNYPVGVGMKDYPIFVGLRTIKHIIWNPVWIPPESDWVSPALRGQVIKPTDPRNPLGKIKIPLGYGYLIHQAKGTRDLGNLVSHGCIRVMRNDLYDLNQKIVSAYSLSVTDQEIAAAKRTKNTFLIEIEDTLPIEITYDTMVIEAGNLHIYPDVYSYRKNTVKNLRRELKINGINESEISDEDLKKMIDRVKIKQQYVISLDQIKEGNYFSGKTIPVLKSTAKKKTRRGE
jgi:hypothetical protein